MDPQPRFLVIDRCTPNGDTPLPDGGRCRVLASFSSAARAVDLATSALAAGQKLSVIDSRWLSESKAPPPRSDST